jgi:threonine dehydratase
MISPLEAPTLTQIEAARDRLKGVALRTPLIRLAVDAPGEIWLKLEMLQPTSSFKLRGAYSRMSAASRAELKEGVYTASAGNMAQGVAWSARLMGVQCRVIVPDQAPATKVNAVERLGGSVRRVSFDEWWRIMQRHGDPAEQGVFVHPVADMHVIAGNATIGLEILEDLHNVDTVIVPFGGGGLSCGIAAALRASRSKARVLAAEVATASPFSAALAAGEPVAASHTPSFVDGIGSKGLLPEMWPMARELLAGSCVMSLEEIANAIRVLVERARVIAEGAGAAPVAAALAGKGGTGRIVCVVSGGNIDTEKLRVILDGRIP